MINGEMNNRLKKVVVLGDISIGEALQVLDQAGTGVLLVCDHDGSILGILTDGDFRRAILHGVVFTQKCVAIVNKDFVYAFEGISLQNALNMMNHSKGFLINHLPVINDQRKVVGLILRTDFLCDDQNVPLHAVVMAGGKGVRLRPFTDTTPKPMLQVGDKPILEHIIKQLHDSGIKKVNISTHYLSEKITSYFGNGQAFGVDIEYFNEDQPLGTAGALSFIEKCDKPLLIINGDVLTNINFQAMYDFHIQHNADLTVGVRKYEMQVPYGVVECEGIRLCDIHEKPKHEFFVNAGVYLMEPSLHSHIPKGDHYDMTDLIKSLIKENKTLISFPITEYWLDIGRPEDFKKANDEYDKMFGMNNK